LKEIDDEEYQKILYKAQLLDLISEHLPDLLWVKDKFGVYKFANKSICENLLMAKSVDEPIGKDDIFFALREREAHKDNPKWHTFGELCFNSDEVTITNNRAMRFEEYGNVKGQLLYLEVFKAPYYNDNGEIEGTVGAGRDITAFKELQTQLHHSLEHLDEIQQFANIGVWEIDVQTGQFRWSDKMYEICELDKSFIPNLDNVFDYIDKKDHKKVNAALRKVLSSSDVVHVSYTINGASGKKTHVLARGKTVFNDNNEATKVLGVTMDVGELYEAREEIKRQKEVFEFRSIHDPLTRLPNRILFMDRLEHSIALATREKRQFSVLFIDLDHFKEINDSLGHHIGDEVLKQVSDRMKNKIRQSDTLARLGGDEFAIILEDVHENSEIISIIEEGMKIIHEPFIIESNTLYIGMSIGICSFPKDAQNREEILKNADAAMYKAKAKGRNTYRFYNSSMTQEAIDKIVLKGALLQGLENHEFVPYFQPKFDLKSNRLIGLEVLVRWFHPEHGEVMPNAFIPLAEATGLVIELDRMLLKSVMSIYKQWREMGLDPGVISVNLSVKELMADDFLDYIDETSKALGCPCEIIEFEITESQLMDKPGKAAKILHSLSERGIKIAIDDFGTGYSSLSYLKKLSVDTLKIDQSFVKDIPHDSDDAAITQAVISLGKSLGLDVVAEGVENQEQVNFLLEKGCDYAQGYFYSKPLNSVEMQAFIEAHCR